MRVSFAKKQHMHYITFNLMQYYFFISAEKRRTAHRTTATQASDNISHSPGECLQSTNYNYTNYAVYFIICSCLGGHLCRCMYLRAFVGLHLISEKFSCFHFQTWFIIFLSCADFNVLVRSHPVPLFM